MNRNPTAARYPLTLQTAYADLLERLKEDSLFESPGTPVLRTRKGRSYWYAVDRRGERSIEKYLGPDSPSLRDQIERLKDAKEQRSEQEKQRLLLTRMCAAGGFPRADAQTGKVLAALAKAGLFRLGAAVVGTHAFRCYPALLSRDLVEARAATEDIDIAAFRSISIALDDRLEPALPEALASVGGFAARPGLHSHPTDRASGTLVELLTPNQGEDREDPIELPALGAHAQPLRFLDYLIHDPMQAAILYRAGVLVNVPRPERYAVHKLIVASRRAPGTAQKAAKDIEQAAALIRVLAEDRPDELQAAWREADERGPSWRAALAKGLRRLPPDARQALDEAAGRG